MTEAVEGWRRNLRFQLARASGSERPRLIREALVEAHPLVEAGKVRRQDVLDIAEAAAREHGITSLKPANSAGFFRSLPSGDPPEAA